MWRDYMRRHPSRLFIAGKKQIFIAAD